MLKQKKKYGMLFKIGMRLEFMTKSYLRKNSVQKI